MTYGWTDRRTDRVHHLNRKEKTCRGSKKREERKVKGHPFIDTLPQSVRLDTHIGRLCTNPQTHTYIWAVCLSIEEICQVLAGY